MYDLVSTSLPNGLLPGTHGFATVAMTRGTPDAVRLALESLSSYKHRHTGHDARYAMENPVTWSHLVQRDGSHVLSCVRAAEFDYTGRTNRLAHHWCFPRGEFPAGTNPADVVVASAATLSASWSGMARWLEPGANPLAAVTPRTDLKAMAWTHFYGLERGPALAAGFAALLRDELQGANRPIVFRTSQAWDVHGTNLLQLFADLIALLPGPLRDRATFSTYPAALPDYVTCHLRGAQPDDPKFPALTAGRPWFDCTTGEAHGTLPQDPALQYVAQYGHERLEVPRGPKPIGSRAAPGTTLPDNGGGRGSTVSFKPGPPAAGRKTATLPHNEWLPPPKKDNTTLYAIIGGLAITVVLLAAFVLLRTGPKPPPPPPAHDEEEVIPLSKDSGTDSSIIAKTTAPPTEAKLVEKAVPPPVVEAPPTNATPPSVASAATPPAPPPRKKWEFEAAERRVSQKQSPEEFKSGFYFFYPSTGMALQQKEATPKDPPAGVPGTKTWGKSPDFATCLVLYDKEDKTAYFEWKPMWSKLFENANSVDLQELCFGSAPAVFKTWDRLCSTWSYAIEWKSSSHVASGTFERSKQNRKLSDNDVITIIAQSKIAELDHRIDECEKMLTAASNRLDSVIKRQTDLVGKRKTADGLAKRLKNASDEIEAKSKILSEEKGKKKRDEEKIKKLEAEIAELREQQDKIKGETKTLVEQLPTDIKTNAGILTTEEPPKIVDRLESYKKVIDDAVKDAEINVKTEQEALAEAKQGKENFMKSDMTRDVFQSLEFTVRVKEAVQ